MFEFMKNPIWWIKISIVLQIIIPFGYLTVKNHLTRETLKARDSKKLCVVKGDDATKAESIEKDPVITTNNYIDDISDLIGLDTNGICIYCRIKDDKAEYGYEKENGEFVPVLRMADGGFYSAQACHRRSSYISLLDSLIRYIDTSYKMQEVPVRNYIGITWLNYTETGEH